jgi:cysteine desulfurase/selenocysteine lyase
MNGGTSIGTECGAAAFGPEALRGEFAFLKRGIAWLDNAATTQKPERVLAAMGEFARRHNANVRRGLNRVGAEATAAYEGARETVARFIGAESAREVVLTSGATASIHLAVEGLARRTLRAGDEVWVTLAEHHSNYLPWVRAAREAGAALRIVPLRAAWRADLEAFRAEAAPGRTKWLAAAWVSNATGAENDPAELAAAAHGVGARVLLDATQGVAHKRLDVKAWGCDFVAFSSHKMYGPTGAGMLWGRSECLAEMEPVVLGGEMVDRVPVDGEPVWAEVPWRFEAGTPDVAAAVGFGEAVRWLEGLPTAAEEHVRALVASAREGLAAVPGVRIWSAPDAEALVTFTVEGVHPHDVAQTLDDRGVAVRAGYLCAEPLLRRMVGGPVVRASFAPYNRMEEVAALVEGVRAAREMFAP